MSQAETKVGAVPVPPAVEGDFYGLAGLLDEEDQLLLKRVRAFIEGTREINTLIVGRAITGLSAFV